MTNDTESRAASKPIQEDLEEYKLVHPSVVDEDIEFKPTFPEKNFSLKHHEDYKQAQNDREPTLIPIEDGILVTSTMPSDADIHAFIKYLNKSNIHDINKQQLTSFFYENLGKVVDDFFGYKPENNIEESSRQWIAKRAGKHISILLGYEPSNFNGPPTENNTAPVDNDLQIDIVFAEIIPPNVNGFSLEFTYQTTKTTGRAFTLKTPAIGLGGINRHTIRYSQIDVFGNTPMELYVPAKLKPTLWTHWNRAKHKPFLTFEIKLLSEFIQFKAIGKPFEQERELRHEQLSQPQTWNTSLHKKPAKRTFTIEDKREIKYDFSFSINSTQLIGGYLAHAVQMISDYTQLVNLTVSAEFIFIAETIISLNYTCPVNYQFELREGDHHYTHLWSATQT